MYQPPLPDNVRFSTSTPDCASDCLDAGEPIGQGPLRFSWSALVLLVHPMKTTIIEAMCWVEEPLSAKLISEMTGGSHSLQFVAYHVKTLAGAGLIVQVDQRSVRGAIERLYRPHPDLIE